VHRTGGGSRLAPMRTPGSASARSPRRCTRRAARIHDWRFQDRGADLQRAPGLGNTWFSSAAVIVVNVFGVHAGARCSSRARLADSSERSDRVRVLVTPGATSNPPAAPQTLGFSDNDGDSDEARALRPLQAAACTYRIALGPRAGQKVLTLHGAMPREKDFDQNLCADMQGFSLHAAVRCGADDRQALEQLCRYITRPALAHERVQTNAAGQMLLKLKTQFQWRLTCTQVMS
jgi:Putative transposase